MPPDNKRQLVLFDVTGISTENVPRELATCFREVLDNGGTIHAEPFGEPAPSPLHWPEQHEVGGGVILLCNFIITSLPSTNVQKLSRLRHTVSKAKTGSASRHIIRISMAVYFSFNVYQSSHDTFYCVFHFRCSVYDF